jgi:hypothetical protein
MAKNENSTKSEKQKDFGSAKRRAANAAKLKKLANDYKPPVEKEKSAPVQAPVQLNLFEDYETEVAAMPNTIARSALFSPISRGRRKYIDNGFIASRHDVKITYSGLQLDMGDSDVFMQAIRLAAKYKLGIEFQILPYSFLRELGRGGKRQPGKGDLLWLQKSLTRLRKSVLTVETEKLICHPSMVLDYTHDKETGVHHLKLDPRIMSLFRQEQYGLIDWEKRKELNIDLAKWLQTFVTSNKKGPQKISMDKIKKWSGQESQRIDHFKKTLKKAFKELEDLKIIKDFELTDKGQITYYRKKSG